MLLRLKPCIMMSPLAVSTYLNSDDIRFDLVVFDEASQVRPFDAVSSIYRGKQLVVAGDQKQLPPTSFFDHSADGDGDEGAADDDGTGIGQMADYESVLDVCLSMNMPRKRLKWHYRSKREPLIAFSNRHFYDDDLVTFPSIHDGDGRQAVEHVFVPEGRWTSGRSGGFNEIEADRVAQMIVSHLEQHPDKSLGVITFNQRQQYAVSDRLEEIRRDRPELEPLFSDERNEPLLLKNLESVQGDERDVIFLSMGYGKDQNGKFYKRFGPINQQGGERRLNVAVTRARERLVFISSVRAIHMDIAASSQRGPHLLKAYLDYAERGVETLGKESVTTGRDFDSPFESEVHAALTREGFDVRSQIGCGGYRIDLAIVHPDEPGRFVLGIECDGASYHSSKTARDRDRLRQLVLEENLGWSIQRIWSTDWIRNPSTQIARIHQRYAELLKGSQRPVPGGDAQDGVPSLVEPILIQRSAGRDMPIAVGSIDEVTDQQISEICRRIVTRHDATEQEDLIRQIARDLGYARTGSRIKHRIESVFKLGLRLGWLTSQGDGRLTGAESAQLQD